jgi:hypothetical protein
LNLAVVYGFGLIVFALILALIYNRACGRRADPLGHQRHRLRRGLSVGGLLPRHLRHDRHGRI